MSEINLRGLLSVIDTKSLKELEYQLHFKENKNQILIFKYINKTNGDLKNQGPDERDIFLKENNIKSAFWKATTNELTKLTEDFLISQQLKTVPIYRDWVLRKILKEKRLNLILEKKLRKEKKSLLTKKIKTDELIFDFWLEKEESEFFLFLNDKKENIEKSIQCIEKLDKYYFTQRIRLMLESLLINIRKTNEPNLEIPLYQEFIDLMNKNTFPNDSIIRIYKTALLLLIDEEGNYQQFFSLVKNNLNSISKIDLKVIYSSFIQFHLARSSQDGSMEKVFELYKEMRAGDFLMEGDFIRPGKIKNCVTIACMFKEFDWAFSFIEDYKNYLEPNIKDSVIHFNLGAIYFYQGSIDKAHEHLSQVNEVNIFYDLDSKSLLSRIFFEKKEFEALTRFIESFRDYIRKNKHLSKKRKEGYLNFLKILKQIIPPVRLSRSKLMDKINSFERLNYKDWLVEKISNMR